MSPSRIVVVGAGQAAAVAARTLRRRGYDGSITLLGEEPEAPYQRPPLSKEYLTAGDDSALYLLPEDWRASQDVELRTGVRAVKISAADGAVLLEDGTEVPADAVLIATGGRPRTLPDAEGDRILYLRSKADADALRSRLGPGVRVVVIGAGFIGAEVASGARELGAEVTVLEAAPVPLQRVLGDTLGAACGALHRAAGVDLRLGVAVEGVEQHGDEVTVTTSEGVFTADVVVVGIGIVPNDDIAQGSGILVDNGILVDEHCRTNVDNVFAAGDVANHYHPLFGTRLRVEHFDNANKQAAAAANNMLGRATVFNDPHWFWSDQFGANLQYVGHTTPQDECVLRGDPADEAYSAFFVRDGLVRAAFAVNRGEDVTAAGELISAALPIGVEVLRDPTTDLMEVLEEELG
jgi:3-phenylpropionate/trans-cinnamate dioxygenase ferredoxin reductase component